MLHDFLEMLLLLSNNLSPLVVEIVNQYVLLELCGHLWMLIHYSKPITLPHELASDVGCAIVYEK